MSEAVCQNYAQNADLIRMREFALKAPFKGNRRFRQFEAIIKELLHIELHYGQKFILNAILSGRFDVITAACGRRFGKSELMAAYLVYLLTTTAYQKFSVIAPTYRQSKIIFQKILNYVMRNKGSKLLVESIKVSPYPVLTFKGGSSVEFLSADKEQNLRGEGYNLVILDEAAYIKDSAISAAIEPMLADFNGQLIKISTPFGKNHFYDTFMMGANPDDYKEHIAFKYSSLQNPYLSLKFLARKQEEFGSDDPIFRQEYRSEFIEDVSNVFGWSVITDCTDKRIELLERGVYGRNYAMGVDLAKTLDYTVITILDISEKPYKVVYWERYNQKRYDYTVEHIKALRAKFNYARVMIDSTGVGEPIYENLDHVAHGFKFSNQSKMNLVRNLVIGMEYRRLVFPPIPNLINELKLFQYVKKATTIGAEAPSGKHDDAVMSLGLAYQAVTGLGTVQNTMAVV